MSNQGRLQNVLGSDIVIDISLSDRNSGELVSVVVSVSQVSDNLWNNENLLYYFFPEVFLNFFLLVFCYFVKGNKN